MKWTVHIDGGPTRVNHAAVCIGDRIYSFGGYYSSEDFKDWEPIPVHVLNTTTNRWSPLEYKKNDVVPFQRYGHTAVADGHKVYMWGGRNNSVACEILSCFDTITLEWSSPKATGSVPYAKDGHTACLIGKKMYVFGGFEYLTDQYSQDVHCLDLETMKWVFVNASGNPPSHRDFHTAVPVGERMYIFGGRGDVNNPFNTRSEVYCPKIYYLDTVEEKWVSLLPKGTWPKGRRSHSAWLHYDYMYIFGGFNGKLMTHFNDVYRYSISGNFWQRVKANGTAPHKRRRQVTLIYKNKAFLFGGTSPNPGGDPGVYVGDDPERLVDNDDLHILDFSPSLTTLAILKVLEYKLDQSSLPRDIIAEIQSMTQRNQISRKVSRSG